LEINVGFATRSTTETFSVVDRGGSLRPLSGPSISGAAIEAVFALGAHSAWPESVRPLVGRLGTGYITLLGEQHAAGRPGVDASLSGSLQLRGV
jgi:hypothetical protein